jgi:hypothetical protein
LTASGAALVLLTVAVHLGCGPRPANSSPPGPDFGQPPRGRTPPSDAARLADAAPPATQTDARPPATPDCSATRLGEFKREGRRTVTVRYFAAPVPAVVYEAGLAIDADGGRHAYKDDGKGLDTIQNACPKDTTKKCWGVLERSPGDKVRQAPPNQAYYVSPTTLGDPDKAETDQARYVDSETIAYLALPLKTLKQMASAAGAVPIALGDLAFVRNRDNGKTAFALFADVGPARKIGEGSIALAEALGIRSSPRNGGTNDGVEVVVFPGSGNRRPRPQPDIDRDAAARLASWGGEARLRLCGAR